MSGPCLACGGALGETLFSIPDLPLVDSFCASPHKARAVPRYSVDLCQCGACNTIQVAAPPDTSDIYRSYIYESASSPDLLRHFTEYAQFVKHSVGANLGKILEIGANDGLLINQLVKAGFRQLVAIDPSPQTRQIRIPGVTVINDFFSDDSVGQLPLHSFSAIIANNCFSHIPRLTSILGICGRLLDRSGTIFVEVQSTLDLVENVVFDYVYHEHYFYHTVTSFEKVVNDAGLELYGVKHVFTKGGSYRFLIGHRGGHARQGSLDYWKYRERVAHIHSASSWTAMTSYLSDIRCKLQGLLSEQSSEVFGYGASATGTVFLRYMNIERYVTAIVDDNPSRQFLFAPGSAIPTLPPEAIKGGSLCLILAWRHSHQIIPALESRGIGYVLPLPELTSSG